MLKKLFLTLMVLFSAASQAQSVFEVHLDSAPYRLEQAREQAAGLVLERLTGERTPWVQEEIVREWERYHRDERSTGGYRVAFIPDALLPLLQSAGLAVLTEPRPALLVWLIEQGQARSEADAAWQRAQQQYPMPLLWPLWDLQEHMDIDKQRLFDAGVLAGASGRYGAGHWLAVEAGQSRWHWQLFAAGEDSPLAGGEEDSPAGVLAAVNRHWIAAAAGREPPRPDNPRPAQALEPGQDGPGELTIVVSGLRQFADIVRLEQRLAELEGVGRALLLDSAGDQARIRLQLSASPEAVLRSLAGSGLTAQGERMYRWTGSQGE